MLFNDLGKLLQGDFGNIFQQVQKAQENLHKIQDELKDKHVEASAGGGKVTVVVNGQQQVLKIVIDPEVVIPDPDEISLLEDMVLVAVNQALEKSRMLAQQEMTRLTGGFDLQGLMNMLPRR